MTLMTIIIFLLIITFVMFVHELGHYIAAKQAGIVVTEFGLGYPPRLWKFWQGKGSISLDNQEFPINRKTNVPHNIRVGSEVIAEMTPGPTASQRSHILNWFLQKKERIPTNPITPWCLTSLSSP